MRDYFRQFLLKPTNLAGNPLADAAPPTSSNTYDSIKTHLVWALATSGIAFAAWKAGQWHSTYKLIQKKLAD
jgi:hypothetical protein